MGHGDTLPSENLNETLKLSITNRCTTTVLMSVTLLTLLAEYAAAAASQKVVYFTLYIIEVFIKT